MAFSENFRFLLDNSDISQIELAKMLGFTPQAVSKWYKGKNEPDTKTIVKIANIFNVSTDYLLGNKKEITSRDEEMVEIKILTKVLQKSGYINDNEDLTNEEFLKLIKFIKANKDFLKNK